MKEIKQHFSKKMRNKRKIILLAFVCIIFVNFFENNSISYALGFSTGLKPGDFIVSEFYENRFHYDANMTLIDSLQDYQYLTENITDIKELNGNIEIHLTYRDLTMKYEQNGIIFLNSSSLPGMFVIPQEYIGFNLSTSKFFDYLNVYFDLQLNDFDQPESNSNITWNHEILANGLGFRINANYTNYNYENKREYNLTLNLYYSISGVLLRRIEVFRRASYLNNYSLTPSDIDVIENLTYVNSTLSSFDGKDERPWDPNYIYSNDEKNLISLGAFEFMEIFGVTVATIIFLTKKDNNVEQPYH